MGGAAAPSTTTFIKKRPLAATAYCGFDRTPEGMFDPLASRVRKSGTAVPTCRSGASTPSRDRHRHQTCVSRDIEEFLPVQAAIAVDSRQPSTPATDRRLSKTVGCKSALAWIRSTDTPPTARRATIAPPYRRKASARRGSACDRRSAPGPRGLTLSSDPVWRRAETAHRATRQAASCVPPSAAVAARCQRHSPPSETGRRRR